MVTLLLNQAAVPWLTWVSGVKCPLLFPLLQVDTREVGRSPLWRKTFFNDRPILYTKQHQQQQPWHDHLCGYQSMIILFPSQSQQCERASRLQPGPWAQLPTASFCPKLACSPGQPMG